MMRDENVRFLVQVVMKGKHRVRFLVLAVPVAMVSTKHWSLLEKYRSEFQVSSKEIIREEFSSCRFTTE